MYFGGQAGNQVDAFLMAFGKICSELDCVSNHIKLETMTIKELRENPYIDSPVTFVDWLVGGHIHFLPCHFHQGLDNFGWSIVGNLLIDRIKLYLCNKILFRYLSGIGTTEVSPWFSDRDGS